MIIIPSYIKSAGEMRGASAAIAAKKKMQTFTLPKKFSRFLNNNSKYSPSGDSSCDTPLLHRSSHSGSFRLCTSLYILKPYMTHLQAQRQGWN